MREIRDRRTRRHQARPPEVFVWLAKASCEDLRIYGKETKSLKRYALWPLANFSSELNAGPGPKHVEVGQRHGHLSKSSVCRKDTIPIEARHEIDLRLDMLE